MIQEVYQDAFNLMCGYMLGSGMTRKVFQCNINSSVVVKVEEAEIRSHFQNVMEWFVWNRVCGTEHEKWFAPVRHLSPDGRLLIMDRTDDIGICGLPDKVPVYFTDLKPANWGCLKGRPVIHDYGTTLLMERGMSKALKKADWRIRDGS